MSFANLSALWSVVGLAVLAGTFFLLQRLRVRHRPVVVETALFWKQAIDESRARVFVQRFRHPWTYVLLLLIASLLWLAFAAPRLVQSGERDHLVLIDGSAAMAWGDRFPAAVASAVEYTAGLPVEHRSVVLCQGRAETLLRPGEDLVLLGKRLADRRPVACASTVASTLRDFARLSKRRPLEICVVGDAPLDPLELAALPEGFEIRRLQSDEERVAGNRGITALGVSPAVSGRWDAVDVLVEVAARNGADATAPTPTLAIGDAAVSVSPVVEATPTGARYRFVDLPAHGDLLEVTLAGGDAIALDDGARFSLPDRRPIRVAVEPGVPDVVQKLVAADAGLRLGDDAPAVVIRRGGSGFGGDVPAIELVGEAAAEDAFLIVHPKNLDPNAVLHELYDSLGLSEIDAMSLARASGRTISMGALPGATRALWIWNDLLREDYDFVNSRSFPLFFGLGVRWLADFDAGPSRVAVGEPLALRGDLVTAPTGRTTRSLSAAFVPTRVGDFASDGGEHFSASLLDPFATTGQAAVTADLSAAEMASSSGFDLVTLLLALALLLLGFEWVLYRRGSIA